MCIYGGLVVYYKVKSARCYAAAPPSPPFFHHLLRSSNLKEVYRPIIEYYEMFDEVWEVLLTCTVHMYTGYMLAVGAHNFIRDQTFEPCVAVIISYLSPWH